MAKQSLLKPSFSRLLALFKGQGLMICCLWLLTLVQVGLSVFLPILIGRAIDGVLSPDWQTQLHDLLVQLVGLVLLNTLIQWLSPILVNRLVYKVVAQLREQVVAHIHRLPFAYLDKQSVGEMLSRVTTDSEQLTTGLLMVFNQLFVGVLTLLFVMVSMVRLDGVMFGLVLLITPLSLLLSKLIAQKSYSFYNAQTKSRGQQVAFLEEAITQQDLVHAFNAQGAFAKRFDSLTEAYSHYSQEAIFYASIVNPVTRFINAVVYGLLAVVGALRIMSGSFSVGELTVFLNYASQYAKPFNDLSSVMAEWQSALACAERLFAVLDEPALEEREPRSIKSQEFVGAVRFENVQFGYTKDQPLIKGLSLDIPAGSQVAIVGPTGAGKTTLINLLMRFYELDAGTIYLDGLPIDTYSREELRAQIGMVLQDTWLKSGTVHDAIAYGCPGATRHAVEEAAKAAKADFFISQLPKGYDTYLAEGGHKLSQGQAQLLAIARVFLKSPKLLILDEATSAIDTRTEHLVQEAFETLMAGRTTFIIAHRLSTIQKSDMILVMEAGDVVEVGNHEQLMAKQGVYYTMQLAGLSTLD